MIPVCRTCHNQKTAGYLAALLKEIDNPGGKSFRRIYFSMAKSRKDASVVTEGLQG
jgi:hypothetical protein